MPRPRRRCAPNRPRVHHLRQRLGEHLDAGAGLHRLGRKHAAERARAGHAAEQAEHVAGDARKPRAARELPLDIGQTRLHRRFGLRERRRLAEDQGIDRHQPPRLLIGGAPHHHAVDAAEERCRLLDGRNAAVEHDR